MANPAKARATAIPCFMILALNGCRERPATTTDHQAGNSEAEQHAGPGGGFRHDRWRRVIGWMIRRDCSGGGLLGGSSGGGVPPPPPGGGAWGGTTMPPPPPGGGGTSNGPRLAIAGANCAGSSSFGGGGAIASTNSFGGSGLVIFPSARSFGAATLLCLSLVSSPLVRSPGERSAIMARKLLADSKPGIDDFHAHEGGD